MNQQTPKIRVLEIMCKKLAQFTVRAHEEEDVFEYLNKHKPQDCEETKKYQRSNVNKIGQKNKKRKLYSSVTSDRKGDIHREKYGNVLRLHKEDNMKKSTR